VKGKFNVVPLGIDPVGKHMTRVLYSREEPL